MKICVRILSTEFRAVSAARGVEGGEGGSKQALVTAETRCGTFKGLVQEGKKIHLFNSPDEQEKAKKPCKGLSRFGKSIC